MSVKPQDNVVSHWATLVDDFETSGLDFFQDIETRVRAREVPAVVFTRVEFRESGLLSDKREYLRMQRDDLIFDVGAAPYGTGFFFSWWLVRSGARFPWLYPLGVIVAFMVVAGGVGGVFGILAGLLASLGGLVGLGKAGLIGPEEHIASAPLIGWLYRRLVNPTTYHALDLVSMYQESIRRAVNEAVDHALKAQGRAALLPEQKRLGGAGLSAEVPGLTHPTDEGIVIKTDTPPS